MNVLVSGATGFVGSAIVRALCRQGHRVIGLVRNTTKGCWLEKIGAQVVVGNMACPATYEPLVRRVDAVVHAAQSRPLGRWTGQKISAMHRSDAVMTRTFANACIAQDKPLVYTSGALSHSSVTPEDWMDELTPLRPCLLAKGHAEMVAELGHLQRIKGLRVMFVTPGFVYGSGGFLQETVDLLQLHRYRIIGAGTNYWSLVHVEDLAEVYVLALERGKPGENYFVADDIPMRRCDVIDHITDVLGLDRVGTVPAWIAGIWLGFPLITAIEWPIRMRNKFVKERLGWLPRYSSFAERLPFVVDQLKTTG